jgi:hypothetical protein
VFGTGALGLVCFDLNFEFENHSRNPIRLACGGRHYDKYLRCFRLRKNHVVCCSSPSAICHLPSVGQALLGELGTVLGMFVGIP